MKMTEKLKEFYVDGAIRDICSTLKGISGVGNAAWTKNIKGKLSECASQFNGKSGKPLITLPTMQKEPNWGEWLYDMCWVDAEPDEEMNWSFKGFYLALESEWGTSYALLCEDFDKLMIVRAPLKVMIYQNFKSQSVKDIAKKLSERANEFSGSVTGEDTYLFAGYNSEGEGSFEFYRCNVGDKSLITHIHN